ncbi:MAG TPA: hypothetical protein PLN48_01725 [Lachnospiraceae bacterium]|nr:hypothetical protein [Lachnospiraceae bacterium]
MERKRLVFLAAGMAGAVLLVSCGGKSAGKAAENSDSVRNEREINSTNSTNSMSRVLSNEDIFRDVSISYIDASPAASIQIENRSEDPFISEMMFHAEPSAGLSIGDEVEITALADSKEAARQGVALPETMKKTIIVKDIERYIERMDELTEEALLVLEHRAEEMMEYSEKQDMAANSEAARRSFSENELQKMFLMTAKEKEKDFYGGGSHNGIGLVYKTMITEEIPDYPELTTKSEQWFLIKAHNLKAGTDGSVIFDTAGMEELEFPSYDALYQSYVAANAGDYNVTES